MSLTVKEKLHWKERIERRIDRRIQEIEASEPAHVWDELRRRAERTALVQLGILAEADEAARIEKALVDLAAEQRSVWTRMLAAVRGMEVAQVERQSYMPGEVRRLIAERKDVLMRQFREEHPKGRLVERLAREKDELLDALWMATSPSQIKELWSHIDKGLDRELPPFPSGPIEE